MVEPGELEKKVREKGFVGAGGVAGVGQSAGALTIVLKSPMRAPAVSFTAPKQVIPTCRNRLLVLLTHQNLFSIPV